MRVRPLTSESNPRLKRVRRLQHRRHREREGLFLVEGPHDLEAALDAGADLAEVFVTAGFQTAWPALAARIEASPWLAWEVSDAAMQRLAATEHGQGVLATAPLLADAEVPHGGENPLILVLEGIGDPGNVGTMIRAAHAAGCERVVLGPGCCDRFNPKAVRASAGALFRVGTLAANDLASLLGALRSRGFKVVVAEPRAGEPCWACDLRGAAAIVIGSEAHGPSEATVAAADALAAIPMPGGAESLNAAMAAGVLLYEALRQRSGG